MGEPFDAIGFRISDEASYQALAEQAHERGSLTQSRRERSTLHGCCWKIGDGIEVWTVLKESNDGLLCLDCRPAFRGRYLYALFPWEIMEYEDDGEAIVRGIVTGSDLQVIFELQNLTEVSLAALRDHPITANVSGLAYSARLDHKKGEDVVRPLSDNPRRKRCAENDHFISGTVLHWRTLKNPLTTSDVVWLYLQTGLVRIEVIVNRSDLKGELKVGAHFSGDVWLQGYILSERELEARYEGIDGAISRGDYWTSLRREN